MLGSKRPAFKPTAYGYSARRKRRIPRWLVLMVTGIVIGAGGLLFIQKSYGPPILTVEQSRQLHDELNNIRAENQRLQSQIALAERERDESQSAETSIKTRLAQHDSIVSALEKDIEFFANAMPADPRGTSPGIRAADFKNANGSLEYAILIMQNEANAPEFKGTISLNVMGRYPNGRTGHIDLEPIPISFGRYIQADGAATLPSGMTARQITIQVFPEGSQKAAAMRIINVR